MVCVLCKSSRVGKVTGLDSLLITIRLKVSILITRLGSVSTSFSLLQLAPAWLWVYDICLLPGCDKNTKITPTQSATDLNVKNQDK